MNNLELAEKIHQNAVDKGFWSEGENSNIHVKRMLVVTELSEAVEAHREGRRTNYTDMEKALNGWMHLFQDALAPGKSLEKKDAILAYRNAFRANVKDTLEDELADAAIRCLDLMYRGYKEDGNKDIFYHEQVTPAFPDTAFAAMTGAASLYALAGMFRYCLASIYKISELYNTDLDRHIKYKMIYNAHRPKMHGGKAY